MLMPVFFCVYLPDLLAEKQGAQLTLKNGQKWLLTSSKGYFRISQFFFKKPFAGCAYGKNTYDKDKRQSS